MNNDTITIVSGLRRSGTSMVMQILEKAGMELLVDDFLSADEFNPNGYYEVRGCRDTSIQINLQEAKSKVVKIFAVNLQSIPNVLPIRVIFIKRNLVENWASIYKCKFKGKKKFKGIFGIQKREMFKQIHENVEKWASKNDNVEILWVDYNKFFKSPEDELNKIVSFVGLDQPIDDLLPVIDENLYKEKNFDKILVTDRAPLSIESIINKYAKDKSYCEIGIGEGHILNLINTPRKKIGVELAKYGVNRCKTLYPEIEVIKGNILDLHIDMDFEVCYLWLVFPKCKTIIDSILQKDKNIIVIMGLNYFYHLEDDDPKAKTYVSAYPEVANAEHWNQSIDNYILELEEQGFNIKIDSCIGSNEEIFSVAIISYKN